MERKGNNDVSNVYWGHDKGRETLSCNKPAKQAKSKQSKQQASKASNKQAK
jgi:hypothetical protein